MVPGVITKLRTRVVWTLMRLLAPEQLARLRATPLNRLLAGGNVQVLNGLGVHALLPAAHFPYWGTQSYGMLSGLHEPMVTEAMRRLLGPGGTFVDVGANIGVASIIGARLVGPEGRVIAIDAQLESAEATREAAALNGHANLETLHAAVTDRDGTTELIVTAEGLWTRTADVGEHELEIRRDIVPAITLDSLRLDRLDAIKIDVEGAELNVIDGMRDTIARLQPAIICEMHGKNAEYVALMEELGYEVENLEGPGPVAEARGNAQSLARPR